MVLWITWGRNGEKFGCLFRFLDDNDGVQKRYSFFILIAIVAVVAVGSYLWFGSPNDIARLPSPVREGMEWVQNYERAMKADTYGGRTPEETLQLFIEALKKEDVELASKYFLLDENGSREKWEKRLADLKEKGLLSQVISDLAKTKPGTPLYEGDFGFVVYNDDGTVDWQIDMEFNKFSRAWKIESF